MSEITLAMRIASIVGLYHTLVSIYLIFFAEEVEPYLFRCISVAKVIGALKGVFGMGVYMTIRQPAVVWGLERFPSEIILPLTLAFLLLFSVSVTWLIWWAFDLDPPQQRLRERVHAVRDWIEELD